MSWRRFYLLQNNSGATLVVAVCFAFTTKPNLSNKTWWFLNQNHHSYFILKLYFNERELHILSHTAGKNQQAHLSKNIFDLYARARKHIEKHYFNLVTVG